MKKSAVTESSKTPKPLLIARHQLDKIDDQILELLKMRSMVVDEIGIIKAEIGMAVHQPQRYLEMTNRLTKKAKTLGLNPELVRIIWNILHEGSVEQQVYAIKTKKSS